jgi:hypothetical protein
MLPITLLKPGSSTTATLSPLLATMLGYAIDVPTSAIVTATTGTLLSATVGTGDRCKLRLVQASGAITSAAKQPLLWTVGSYTQVSGVAGAAAKAAACAGFALLGATGSANAASGDIFWVVERGPVIGTAVAAFIAFTPLAQHAGPGLDDTTVTYDTALCYSVVLASGAGDAVVRATLG